MDPVTHALLGSAVARVALTRPLGHAAWLPGAAGALLPDADAFIRSAADPLLYAEFHRHVTHSLAFVPIGGVVASLPWTLRRSTQTHWKPYLAAATVGYATHGLLDACTTWGTSLLWPFSEMRAAWSWISIVDPLFTMVLLAGVAGSVWRRSATAAAVALVLCAAYLGLGALQQERARSAQRQLASARGHSLVRGAVFPGFANSVIWRSLYESGGRLYMDRIRMPFFGQPSWSPGTSVAALDLAISATSTRAHDLRRFARFTNGWMALAPDETGLIGDARYSMSAAEYQPVWGIRFRDGSPGVSWVDRSAQRRVDVRQAIREITGRDDSFRPLGDARRR